MQQFFFPLGWDWIELEPWNHQTRGPHPPHSRFIHPVYNPCDKGTHIIFILSSERGPTSTSWWDINYLQLRYIVMRTKVKSISVPRGHARGLTHASDFSPEWKRPLVQVWSGFHLRGSDEDTSHSRTEHSATSSAWPHAHQCFTRTSSVMDSTLELRVHRIMTNMESFKWNRFHLPFSSGLRRKGKVVFVTADQNNYILQQRLQQERGRKSVKGLLWQWTCHMLKEPSAEWKEKDTSGLWW